MNYLKEIAVRPTLVALLYTLIALTLWKLVMVSGVSFPVVGDSHQYLAIAKGLLDGTYPTIEGEILPPGYPVVLAITFLLFGVNYNYIYLVQFLFLGGVAWLVHVIARRHFSTSPLLAVSLGLIVLCWPYFLLYSLLIYSEVTYTLIFISTALILLEAWQRDNKWLFACAGFMIAIAVMTRPVALLLPFWIAGFIMLFCLYRKQLTTWWKHIAIAFMAFVLTLVPWSLYTFTQTGVPTPVSTHFHSVAGRSLDLSYEPWRGYSKAENAPTEELIQSKFLNVLRFWNPGAGGTQAELLTKKAPLAAYGIIFYKIGFFLMLGLAFASLFVPHKKRWFLWVIILYFWSVHTVLYPFPRYTLPIIPLVIILAGLSLTQLHTRFTTTPK